MRRHPQGQDASLLPCVTADCTCRESAWTTGACPTTATGACSQRPTQGAAITFTSLPSNGRQALQQILRAAHFAGQSVAHAHGESRRLLAFAQHFEVVIERRDFEDFRHRHIHLPGQRHQMPVVQAAIGVVELVQVLDQQVAPVRARGRSSRSHLGHRR